MKINKVLVSIYVPIIEKKYDVWLAVNKTIANVIIILSSAINELEGGIYNPTEMPLLLNKLTGRNYDINSIIKNTDIRNGTELILI